MFSISEIENLFVSKLKKTKDSNDVPVCAAVIDSQGRIVGFGQNSKEQQLTICGHAEINAINNALKFTRNKTLKGLAIVSVLEPCMMCLGAIIQANIKKIFYYLPSQKYGFLESNHTFDISSLNIQRISNDFSRFYQEKLNIFFKKLR